MCLVVKIKENVKNLIVYKILIRKPDGLYSPYENHKYSSYETVDSFGVIYGAVHKGLHSIYNLEYAKRHALVLSRMYPENKYVLIKAVVNGEVYAGNGYGIASLNIRLTGTPEIDYYNKELADKIDKEIIGR